MPISMSVTEFQNGSDGKDEQDIRRQQQRNTRYDWRKYAPKDKKCLPFFRWLIVGGASYAQQSEEQLNENLRNLAICLSLIREYLSRYDMPERGSGRDQELVLREVFRDLYFGGAPIWALEPVMQKAAEGLTGHPNVNWLLLPRKAFMFSPSTGTTSMFKTERSFCMSKLDAMEKVAIRLASFATNVSQGASSIPSRLPTSRELYTAARSENARQLDFIPEKEALAFKILCLASDAEGLFFFVNSQSQQEQQSQQHEQPDQGAGATTTNSSPKTFRVHFDEETSAEMTIDKVSNYKSSAFWNVSDSERELFSRLATIEALKAIDEIDKQEKKTCLYSRWLITFFRLGSSAGACAIWFNGSWPDMLIAGFLAVFVAHFQTSNILTKQERIVFEIVASFVVGLTAGILALNWPNHFCFGAMALSGVLDILQGFRVVYSIIEIMSKHTVAGGADLLEGMLFTGLISYFLKFGQYTAARLMGDPKSTTFAECKNGINQWWYLLFLPLAAFSWSALFNPNYVDLPLMGLHGILAYAVNWGLAQVGVDEHLNNFVASLSVSLFAGIVSRFTGRQAVGNTVAGLYVLLPGAYLVRSLYSSDLDATFFIDIIQNSVIIGIGAWTGTIVCSPTLLGTTKGLLAQQSRHNDRGREQSRGTNDTTMLFF